MSRRIVLALAITCATAAHGQQNPGQPESLPLPAAPLPEETQLSPVAPCLQPVPMVRWQDYRGPLQKVVGAFGRRLERKSVGAPHYKHGAVLCSLTLGGKFLLFAGDTFDPITFLSVGFTSGIGQAQNDQPAFGQGAAGYGKRFGYNFSLQASGEFFSVVVYSTIFSEDPRYYRLGHGSTRRRFFHALAHSVVAKRENGANEFNYSEWLAVASTAALSRAYHTGGRRDLGNTAEGIGLTVAQDAGFNVLREFWPELAHKFKLPFRDENQPQLPGLLPH
jgi:hypothetical protein